MKHLQIIMFGVGLLGQLATVAPVAAQGGYEEIVVTATRREADDYDESAPLIGLRRTADFAVQSVKITGDTRDAPKRRDEIFAMVRNAIQTAARDGLELSTGEVVLTRLTLDNYRDLALTSDNRPDTEAVHFYVKASLKGVDSKAALDRITRYVKAVSPVGRAEMLAIGDLTLSVVNPDQYRAEIVGLVAADAQAIAAAMGAGYGVDITGLDKRVLWARDGLTGVMLYVPYSYRVLKQ